ncbi:hypothetical protein FRC01_003488 [Tulasnella sp. 417]|nr:hypothetical protein FRC01_003488 [Tulasnella sp. 417]
MERRKHTLPLFNLNSSLCPVKLIPESNLKEPQLPPTATSPFAAFPIELISLIFLYAISRNTNESGLWEPIKRVRPLASITLVSRQWYKVATSTPELWSTIIVTTQRWFPSELADLWLNRAKNAKLDVHLISDNPKIPRLQVEVWKRVVEEGAGRVCSLSMIVGAADWMRIKPLLPTQLPALVSAKLFIMDASAYGDLPVLHEPVLEVPKLEQLVTNSPACLNFASCPKLRHLELTRLEEGINQADVLWERIRHATDKMPNLRHLKLSSNRPPLLPASGFAGFDFINLETLYLDLKGRVASVDFLSHIRAPALIDVTIISFRAEAPPPEPFPTINLPSLHSIRLTNTSLRQSLWLLDHLSYGVTGSNSPQLEVVVEMDVRDGWEAQTDNGLRNRLRKKCHLRIMWSSGASNSVLKQR